MAGWHGRFRAAWSRLVVRAALRTRFPAPGMHQAVAQPLHLRDRLEVWRRAGALSPCRVWTAALLGS